MLPKLFPAITTPLTKAIRTLEGVVVVVFNAAMVIVPIVTSLSPGVAVKYAAIVNTALIIGRSILKAVASLTGIQAPALPDLNKPEVTP